MSKVTKRNRLMALILSLCVMVSMSIMSIGTAYAGTAPVWSGEADTSWYSDSQSTFYITTAEQLRGIGLLNADGKTFEGKTIILSNDLYLNSGSDKYSQWGTTAPARKWVPIGNHDGLKYFSGTFDGNGHTIYGMYMSGNGYSEPAALFNAIGKGAVVKNLTVAKSYIKNCKDECSMIVALLEGGTVKNCKASGIIVASNFSVGGIVGSMGINNKGSLIKDCTSNVAIYGKGQSYLGGIVGHVSFYGGDINGCTNKGKVIQGKTSVGGIAGAVDAGLMAESGDIINCTNNALVAGSTTVGGIVGYHSNETGRIKNCKNTAGIIGASTSSTVKRGQIYGQLLYNSAVVINNTSAGKVLKKDLVFSSGYVKYKITSLTTGGSGKVKIIGTSSNTRSTYKLPSTVNYKKAPLSLTYICKNSFSKIKSSATIGVPKAKKTSYTKMLKNSGLSSKNKIYSY